MAKANGDTLQFKVLSTSLSQCREQERAKGQNPNPPIPTEAVSMETQPKETEEISEPLELREICPDPNTAIAMPDIVEEKVVYLTFNLYRCLG